VVRENSAIAFCFIETTPSNVNCSRDSASSHKIHILYFSELLIFTMDKVNNRISNINLDGGADKGKTTDPKVSSESRSSSVERPNSAEGTPFGGTSGQSGFKTQKAGKQPVGGARPDEPEKSSVVIEVLPRDGPKQTKDTSTRGPKHVNPPNEGISKFAIARRKLREAKAASAGATAGRNQGTSKRPASGTPGSTERHSKYPKHLPSYKSVVAESLKLAIHHKGLPFKSLTEDESSKVIKVICDALDQVGMDEEPLQFERTGKVQGILTLECSDLYSYGWLVGKVSSLDFGFSVESTCWTDLPQRKKVCFWINRSINQDADYVLNRLGIQNRTLRVEKWSIDMIKPGANQKVGCNFVFYIDEESFQALQAMDFRPRFQLFRIQAFLWDSEVDTEDEAELQQPELAGDKDMDDGGG
jgi:hypothetical protein